VLQNQTDQLVVKDICVFLLYVKFGKTTKLKKKAANKNKPKYT